MYLSVAYGSFPIDREENSVCGVSVEFQVNSCANNSAYFFDLVTNPSSVFREGKDVY